MINTKSILYIFMKKKRHILCININLSEIAHFL